MNLYFGSFLSGESSGGAGTAGMVVDEIRLQNVITVPEPSVCALFGVGAAFALGKLRRRKA